MSCYIKNNDLTEKQIHFLKENGFKLQWFQCECGACDEEQVWLNPNIEFDSEKEDWIYNVLEELS